ncbi:efflux RND transporter periplasmic adaptor subunit [Pseudomonas sp. C27(2019)]|uniref:efflux RND transporter periplasmic adaptor subunit n=1 Tax=Pseudomonas sp. C27(2019) TaxID=2604941 RepID=UPI001244FB68|nr:efflux RND transporter periplasmic adaptor subunit [Pseudomonas sp. C27(2019)]QEY59749.1 efflux RND transporter periplasmic adaptor subunit [Pseudomonas sp. C27(2019)]
MIKLFIACTLSVMFIANPVMAQNGPAGGGQMPMAQPAGVITVKPEPVPLTVTLSGQALAEDDATIRPLVDGVITDILYRAGTRVEKGDLLFQIEQDSYQAALEAARAALDSAQAAVPSAQENFYRYQQLAGTGVTQAQVDMARTDLRQAQAAVSVAQADLRTAEIQLQRTNIVSPISGIVETAQVSIGDLVTAGQADVLTTVTRLDPIYIDLSEASVRMLEMRKRIDSGEFSQGAEIDAYLILENGEQYATRGTVESVGRKVSASTGTLRVRVKFANPEQLILPGMFVRVNLTLGQLNAYRIPQLAAKAEPDGTLTIWTLDEQQAAKKLSLIATGTHNNAWVIEQGLQGAVPVLVDNIDNLQEGTAIQPVAVIINDKGVVIEQAPAEPVLEPSAAL